MLNMDDNENDFVFPLPLFCTTTTLFCTTKTSREDYQFSDG